MNSGVSRWMCSGRITSLLSQEGANEKTFSARRHSTDLVLCNSSNAYQTCSATRPVSALRRSLPARIGPGATERASHHRRRAHQGSLRRREQPPSGAGKLRRAARAFLALHFPLRAVQLLPLLALPRNHCIGYFNNCAHQVHNQRHCIEKGALVIVSACSDVLCSRGR